MRRASVKNCKLCAFCTHWYDPGNSAIEPLNPGLNLWNYDEKAKSFCTIRPGKIQRLASQSCSQWVCKIT
jgi:hypothetical protein